ncbi:Glutaminyl-peptide cyclotransferase [Hypsibius exemplaris]|uniref:Glutaminyl-peptide cyclotransferase n=1 Tax=Hypsibius exemplaris TaxID=2072580 RepID=A0A1W0WU29_HYPEX|nr:Glutaminyl-peptide cyclotransferase [Hypsibius exemplaris]
MFRMGRQSFSWEVLVLCSAFFHRSAAQKIYTASTAAPLPRKVSWLEGKRNFQVTPLAGTEMVTVAKFSDPNQFRRLLSPLLVPRVAGTPGNAAVRTFITGQLSQLGYTIELDSFFATAPAPFGTVHFTNIIATLDPSAPRRLVLACHFDSKFMEQGAFSGATDSAVPCAMMLDLAVTLSGFLRSPRTANEDITLQLMFFDGEEAFVQWTESDSLYGSRHLAEKLEARPHSLSSELSNLAGIDLFVLMDLIGGPSPTFRNFFPETASNFARLSAIESTLRDSSNVLHAPTIRSDAYFPPGAVPQFFRVDDDHVPFQQRGVPILHLIPVPFPDVWHTLNDDEAHLDFPAIEDLNSILRVFVCEYLTCNLNGTL